MRHRHAGPICAAAITVFTAAHAFAAGSAPLIDAVRRSDTRTVQQLLQQRANVNATEVDGTTALHWAVQVGDQTTVDLLIKAGANVNARNRYGIAPISVASDSANAAVVGRLLDAGADPNTVQPGGETALMTAARNGSVATIKTLLAHGADVNAKESRRDQTALMWATAENNADAVRTLLEAGADMTLRTRPTGRLSGQEPGERAFTALTFGAQLGASDAVGALLAAGGNVNETLPDGMSLLVVAVSNAQFDMAAFLLDKGANPNAAAQGWTALHQLLWNRRANQGNNQVFPVPRGSVDSMSLAKKLIAHGADVNAQITKKPNQLWMGRSMLSWMGATPFFAAAHKFDVGMMHVLLDAGANAFIPNEEGTTPLMTAAGVGINVLGENPGTVEEITAAVQLCLDLGASPFDTNWMEDTALHGAAYSDAPPAVKLLVAAGAKLDAENNRGWRPLRIAVGGEVNGALRTSPMSEVLIRQMMLERGIPIRPEEESTAAAAAASDGIRAGPNGVRSGSRVTTTTTTPK